MESEIVKFQKSYGFKNEVEVIVQTITCVADAGCFMLMSEDGATLDIMNGYGDGIFKAHFVKNTSSCEAIDYMWELLRTPNRGIRMLNIASRTGTWWISSYDCGTPDIESLKENGGMCIGSNWTAYMDWDDHELWIAQSWEY